MDSDSSQAIDRSPSTGPSVSPTADWAGILRRYDGWFVALLLILLSAVAYPRVFLKGEVISPASILYWYPPWDRLLPAEAIFPKNNVLSDEIDSTIPEVKYLREQLLRGDIPAWRDITSNGTPMFWVIINQLMVAPLLLLVLIFDTAQGLSLFALARQVAAGWFFYKYARIMGICRWASLASAIAFSYGSFPVQTFGRSLSFQLMLLPASMYAMERIIRDTSLRWIAVLPVLLHWNIVSGFPAGTIYCFYFLVLYGLYRIVAQPGRRLRLLGLFVALGAVAVMFSAPALIATSDFFQSFDWSYRAERWRARLPWISLTTSLVPFLAGDPTRTGDVPGAYYWWFEHGVYIGVLPILTLVASIIYFRPATGRLFFLGFGLWLFILLFDIGGILERVVQHVPGLKSNPNTRQKMLLFFVLCILAAYALDDITRAWGRRRMFRWATLAVIAVLAGAAYSALAYYSGANLTGFVRAHLLIQIPVILASVLILWMARIRGKSSGTIKFLVIALIFVDLQLMDKCALGLHNDERASVSQRILDCFDIQKAGGWNPTIKQHLYFRKTPGITFLQQNIGDVKMLSLDRAFLANTPLYFGLNNISGRAFLSTQEKEMYRVLAEEAFRESPTQFLFKSNISTRLDRSFVDALGIKYVVFAPGQSIDDLLRDDFLRQKEWNHQLAMTPGMRIRQSFIAPRTGAVNTIALHVAEYELAEAALLTLRLYDETEQSQTAGFKAEWFPLLGSVVFDIGHYAFVESHRYAAEFTLGRDAVGSFHALCTRKVYFIEDGELRIDGAKWRGDLCFAIYQDIRRSSGDRGGEYDLSKFELVHRGDLVIYENKQVFPRAWLVGGLRFASDDETLAGLKSNTLDLRQEAWAPIADQTAIGDAGRAAEAPGRVAAKSLKSSRQTFDVQADRDCFLIVNDNFHRNWSARIDGQPASIFRADYNFRGVRIPAGTHVVELTYRPPYLYSTVAVALLSGAGLLLFVARASWRRRSHRAAAQIDPIALAR